MAKLKYAEEICRFLDRGDWWLSYQIFDGIEKRFAERMQLEKPGWWRRNFPKSWEYWHRPYRVPFSKELCRLRGSKLIEARQRVIIPGMTAGLEYRITRAGINRHIRHKPPQRNFGIPEGGRPAPAFSSDDS